MLEEVLCWDVAPELAKVHLSATPLGTFLGPSDVTGSSSGATQSISIAFPGEQPTGQPTEAQVMACGEPTRITESLQDASIKRALLGTTCTPPSEPPGQKKSKSEKKEVEEMTQSVSPAAHWSSLFSRRNFFLSFFFYLFFPFFFSCRRLSQKINIRACLSEELTSTAPPLPSVSSCIQISSSLLCPHAGLSAEDKREFSTVLPCPGMETFHKLSGSVCPTVKEFPK